MRLEVTRKTDLALRAMRALQPGGTKKGKDLALLVGATDHFLPQVMSPLVRRGWVVSEPGPRGGYRLSRPLESSVIPTVK